MSPSTIIALDHFATATGGRSPRVAAADLLERCLVKGNIRKTMEALGYTPEQVKTYLGLRLQPYEDTSGDSTPVDEETENPAAVDTDEPAPVKAAKAPKAPKLVAVAAPAVDGEEKAERSPPVSVTIDGVSVPATNWREVYAPLVEAIYVAGKVDEIKSTFITDAPHPIRPAGSKKLSFGKYLDVALSGAGTLARCKKMAEILGVPVSYTTADGNTVTL